MSDRQKVNFRIIIIDDNVAIHRDFIKILTANGTHSELAALDEAIFGEKKSEEILPQFEIDTALQGKEGVKKIKQALEEARPYALAFVDIRMPPGWDGIETIKHIWEIDKDVQIVICTAFSDYSWEETVEHLGQSDNLLILKKPFDNIAVRQLASALTRKWQLMQDARRYTLALEKKVEERTASLQKSLSLVKATLESSDDGILVVNNDRKIVEYNQRFLRMCRIPEKYLAEKNESEALVFLAKELEDPADFFEKIEDLYVHNNMTSIDLLKFKDGRLFERYSQPQKIDEKTVGRVWSFRDITQRAELEKELHRQATHDVLTGLPNRVLLLEKIKNLLDTEKIKKNKQRFAILFFDLDRFKLINDSFSHAVGDELLRAVANRLKKTVRKGDALARLGGDEFVMIVSDFDTDEQLIVIINKLIHALTKPFKIQDRNIVINACIGISIYPTDGETADVLLRNADSAMYFAKENGANQFQFYTEQMSHQSLERLDQESQLRNAIHNNEFFLCYQPQVDLLTEKLMAVEALIRWQHPQKGVVYPMEFIPLAEETGLIVQIGEWVMRTACAQNKKWQEEGLPPIRIAVNVASQQFRQKNIVQFVKEVLVETGLRPEYLEIEVTENVIIRSMDIIMAIIQLKEMGVHVTLDDFGTGYSSLSYLKKIPLDRLKIDQSFIQNIKKNNDDEVIIRAIIAMANSLDLDVLAEGVETKSQFNFLKLQDCGQGQGYFFSKPLSPDEMHNLLEKAKEKLELTG